MQINLNIEEFLQTEEGQEIAKKALVEAFNNQARQYFYNNGAAISNLAYYVVEHCIGMDINALRERVSSEIKGRLESKETVKYLEQNHVVKFLIENTVRENADILKSQVLKKLEDPETYDHFGSYIADAIVKELKE